MTEVEPVGGPYNNQGGGKEGGAPGLNVNRYATKKTIAQGMLDIALLTANASQLKYVLQAGKTKHPFYTLMISLISVSIFLQITVGICFLVIGSLNINRPKSQRVADILNNTITMQIFVITAINVVISSFGIEAVQIEESDYYKEEAKRASLIQEQSSHLIQTNRSIFQLPPSNSLSSSGKVTFNEDLLG